MKAMLIAGEASGDLYGAHLARALREVAPDLTLFGMGGSQMEEAGVRLLFNPLGVSVIGFTEVLAAYRLLRRVLREQVAAVARERPDVVVTIDFPGFNLRLAREVRGLGVPVLHYVGPAVWAWGRRRAKKVARWTTAACSIFPFEAEILRAYGAKAYFVGHPLVDLVRRERTPAEFLVEAGLDGGKPVVALLPGSRGQELRRLLPEMTGAAAIILRRRPEVQFVLALAPHFDRSKVEAELPKALGIRVVQGATYDAVASAQAAIVASGTATLETALLGTPMVATYRVSRSTALIAGWLRHTRYVTLPNIVAGREVIPELLQEEATADRLAEETLRYLEDPSRVADVQAAYREISQRLGRPGVAGRVARAVLAVAAGRDPGDVLEDAAGPVPGAAQGADGEWKRS